MVQEIYHDVDLVIERFVEELGKFIRVQRVILFGSYARGNPRPWSDIDIVVVSPDFHGGTEEDHLLLARVARRIAPQIEALPYLPQDLDDCDLRTFEASILGAGRIVYDSAV